MKESLIGVAEHTECRWAPLPAWAIGRRWSCSVVELAGPFTASFDNTSMTECTWLLWWRGWRRAVWGTFLLWTSTPCATFGAEPTAACSLHASPDRRICSLETESYGISCKLEAAPGALWDFIFLRSRMRCVNLPGQLQQKHTLPSGGSEYLIK